MKKFLLLILLITATICINAQGTWKATGTETTIAAGTEISMGIASLKATHSDASGVVGKSDSGSPTSSYHGVNYDNPAIIQGGTNGMYYAFVPSKSGTLDIAIKMGSAKKTFFLELKDEAYTSLPATVGDLAALTSGYATADLIAAANFTTPSVYDTYHQSSGTWDGTVAFQSTGSNVYFVGSFSVTANKTYVVGCYGSKLMLRGVTLATTTNAREIPAHGLNVFPNPAKGKLFVDVSEPTELVVYNITGTLILQKKVTSLQDYIDVSKFTPGMYFVRSLSNKYETQRVVIK